MCHYYKMSLSTQLGSVTRVKRGQKTALGTHMAGLALWLSGYLGQGGQDLEQAWEQHPSPVPNTP